MSNTKVDFLAYKVKDISLADYGRKEIEGWRKLKCRV